ncbi:Cysteine and histidine-rich protein 1-A, partial [Ophiophagus hannah]
FTVLNQTWVLKARVNDSERNPNLSCKRTLSFQLILKSKVSTPMECSFLLLKGPYDDVKINPVIYHFAFSNENNETEYMPLPIIDSVECNKLLAAKNINLQRERESEREKEKERERKREERGGREHAPLNQSYLVRLPRPLVTAFFDAPHLCPLSPPPNKGNRGGIYQSIHCEKAASVSWLCVSSMMGCPCLGRGAKEYYVVSGNAGQILLHQEKNGVLGGREFSTSLLTLSACHLPGMPGSARAAVRTSRAKHPKSFSPVAELLTASHKVWFLGGQRARERGLLNGCGLNCTSQKHPETPSGGILTLPSFPPSPATLLPRLRSGIFNRPKSVLLGMQGDDFFCPFLGSFPSILKQPMCKMSSQALLGLSSLQPVENNDAWFFSSHPFLFLLSPPTSWLSSDFRKAHNSLRILGNSRLCNRPCPLLGWLFLFCESSGNTIEYARFTTSGLQLPEFPSQPAQLAREFWELKSTGCKKGHRYPTLMPLGDVPVNSSAHSWAWGRTVSRKTLVIQFVKIPRQEFPKPPQIYWPQATLALKVRRKLQEVSVGLPPSSTWHVRGSLAFWPRSRGNTYSASLQDRSLKSSALKSSRLLACGSVATREAHFFPKTFLYWSQDNDYGVFAPAHFISLQPRISVSLTFEDRALPPTKSPFDTWGVCVKESSRACLPLCSLFSLTSAKMQAPICLVFLQPEQKSSLEVSCVGAEVKIPHSTLSGNLSDLAGPAHTSFPLRKRSYPEEMLEGCSRLQGQAQVVADFPEQKGNSSASQAKVAITAAKVAITTFWKSPGHKVVTIAQPWLRPCEKKVPLVSLENPACNGHLIFFSFCLSRLSEYIRESESVSAADPFRSPGTHSKGLQTWQVLRLVDFDSQNSGSRSPQTLKLDKFEDPWLSLYSQVVRHRLYPGPFYLLGPSLVRMAVQCLRQVPGMCISPHYCHLCRLSHPAVCRATILLALKTTDALSFSAVLRHCWGAYSVCGGVLQVTLVLCSFSFITNFFFFSRSVLAKVLGLTPCLQSQRPEESLLGL